jgi:transmembrane 9 superfamily member 2/4
VVTSEDGVAMVKFDHKSGFQIVGFEVVPCSVRHDLEAMSKLKMYDKVDSMNCPLELEKSQVIRENEWVTFTYEVEYVKSNIR